jgi:hypothetical protein
MTLASASHFVRVALGVTLASAVLALAAVGFAFGEGNRLESLAGAAAGGTLLWFSLTRRTPQ